MNPETEFKFTYKGVEYDATDYAGKHPGGIAVLENMRDVKKDFTEYFRALHSDKAENVLKSFKVVSREEPSQASEEYMQIYQKVESYNAPLWSIEILLFALLVATWFLGCMTDYPVLSVVAFAFTQILIGWVAHSASHNRNTDLNMLGRVEAGLLGGLSVEWWSPKHNMHHMFTNIQKFDEDIQHSYKVYLYPFLYLKWRMDSIESAVREMNWIELACILANYSCLYVFRANIVYFILGELIAGFYSAVILIGNHEKEIRFAENPKMDFIDHQVKTCRNYEYESLFWLLLMGGMQYQTEHHLFPKIPFYRLPRVKNIITAELGRLNKSMIYGPVY